MQDPMSQKKESQHVLCKPLVDRFCGMHGRIRNNIMGMRGDWNCSREDIEETTCLSCGHCLEEQIKETCNLDKNIIMCDNCGHCTESMLLEYITMIPIETKFKVKYKRMDLKKPELIESIAAIDQIDDVKYELYGII